MRSMKYRAQFDGKDEELLVPEDDEKPQSLWQHFLDSFQTPAGMEKLKESIHQANDLKDNTTYEENKKQLDDFLMKKRLTLCRKRSTEKVTNQVDTHDEKRQVTDTMKSTKANVNENDEMDEYRKIIDQIKQDK